MSAPPDELRGYEVLRRMDWCYRTISEVLLQHMLTPLPHRVLHASQITRIIVKTFESWNDSHVKMLLVMPLP